MRFRSYPRERLVTGIFPPDTDLGLKVGSGRTAVVDAYSVLSVRADLPGIVAPAWPYLLEALDIDFE